MKRLLAVILALLTALSAGALTEDDGGEGVIHFPDEAQEDSFLSDTNLSSIEPFMPDTLEKTIIGEDNREIISKPKLYPFSAIAYIEMKYECGCTGGATAFMVTQNTAMTAAHCVYCYKHDKWARKITFYFGYKSRKNYLYRYKSKWTAWVGTKFPDQTYINTDDWALVKLNKKVGEKTGWLGMRFCSDDELMGKTLCLAGFGGEDKLRSCWGKVTEVKEKTVGYDMDMLPGNSGSPVFDEDDYVYAINTNQNPAVNWGRRLTPEIRQTMEKNGML